MGPSEPPDLPCFAELAYLHQAEMPERKELLIWNNLTDSVEFQRCLPKLLQIYTKNNLFDIHLSDTNADSILDF